MGEIQAALAWALVLLTTLWWGRQLRKARRELRREREKLAAMKRGEDV